MRDRFLRATFVAAALTPFVVASLLAQEPSQPPQGGGRGGSVQVGVPEGRGGAPAQQGGPGRGARPAKPAPRGANGRALLGGATPSEKGVWLPGNGGAQTMVADLNKIPFQPWAKALHEERGRNQLEPHTRCKPSGFVRQFLTPYGVEIVELAEMQRVYIFDIGGPHTYRTIFNESFWMDRRGLPHTEKLRTLERFTRTDSNTIKYEVTVDDPDAYTSPWKSEFNLRWEAGTELFEYVCQEANYAHTLMVGDKTAVDRTSIIVP
jgi:hypothetical protein